MRTLVLLHREQEHKLNFQALLMKINMMYVLLNFELMRCITEADIRMNAPAVAIYHCRS